MTGRVMYGISMIAQITDSNMYHPKNDAAMKKAPVATHSFEPSMSYPCANCHSAPVAVPKPAVAQMKMRKKTRFVRSDPMRKINDRMVIETV